MMILMMKMISNYDYDSRILVTPFILLPIAMNWTKESDDVDDDNYKCDSDSDSDELDKRKW